MLKEKQNQLQSNANCVATTASVLYDKNVFQNNTFFPIFYESDDVE